MRAWACGLYSNLAYNMPRNSMSSVKAGLPFASLTASTLISGLPTTAISGTSRDGTTRGRAGENAGGGSFGSTSTGFVPSVIGGSISGANGSTPSPRSTAAARRTASTGFT